MSDTDLVDRKLYVTGGCGALYDGASPDAGQDYFAVTRVHQAYGRPYQLPNTTAYNESCASLGLVMWAWRLLALTGEARYADEIERVLDNALPAMIGADGKSYFYTNPLRQVRDLPYPLRRAGNPRDSVPPPSHERGRQEYMTACFCCPPNIARHIAELPYLAYSRGPSTLWVHQFAAGRATTEFGGVPVTVQQETAFPADGDVRIRVSADAPVRGELRIRVPGWADRVTVTVDGEAVDLLDDVDVDSVAIPGAIDWTEEPGSGSFAGHVLLRGTAARLPAPTEPGKLYAELNHAEPTPLDIRLVPYALWGNRGAGEMSVWLQLLR